jgi:hypothetical protein
LPSGGACCPRVCSKLPCRCLIASPTFPTGSTSAPSFAGSTGAGSEALSGLAREATALATARYRLDRATFRRIQGDLLAGDAAAGRKLGEWWSLDFRVLRDEVDRQGGLLKVKERGEWEEYLREQRQGHERLTAELVAVEAEINRRVCELFGLSAAEIALVERETRYGLGGLQARLRGIGLGRGHRDRRRRRRRIGAVSGALAPGQAAMKMTGFSSFVVRPQAA